jgi:hypothetical protein
VFAIQSLNIFLIFPKNDNGSVQIEKWTRPFKIFDVLSVKVSLPSTQKGFS